MSKVEFWMQHLDTIHKNHKKRSANGIGDLSEEERSLQEDVKETQHGGVVSVTVFMKTKPRKRTYRLSAASVGYGTMWGVYI